MDEEIERIPHVRTPVMIADSACGESTVWKINLLIVPFQENSCQDIHLFYYHLKTIKGSQNKIWISSFHADFFKLFLVPELHQSHNDHRHQTGA